MIKFLNVNYKCEGTINMKAIVIAALLALSFTTGFTCSKNQPAEQAPVAAPVETAPAATPAPADAAAMAAPAADAAVAAPAAPTEAPAAPAAPAGH